MSENGIDIWRLRIDTQMPASAETLANMSGADRARFNRFILPKDKNAFAESRRVLRLLIAQSNLVPDDTKIVMNETSRPELSGNTGAVISWSRSGEFLAVAISTDVSLGIDIEHRRDISHTPMLTMMSTPEEREAFGQLPETDQPEAFLRLWTIKEAVLKGLGTGFQADPKSVAVPIHAYAAPLVGSLPVTCSGQEFTVTIFENDETVMSVARGVS